MKRWFRMGSAVAALTLVGAPLQAQDDGLDVRLNPRIGLYESLTSLAEVEQAGETVAAELGGALALGLSLQIDGGMLPIGVRVNVEYVTGSQVYWENGGIRTEEGEVTLLTAAGDVMVRVLPRSFVVSPYLFAGGGLKHYDFTLSVDSTIDEFRNESDPTFHFGGGIDLGLGPLALVAEIGDYVSWYEPDPTLEAQEQHDMFVTVGLSIGLI
jgi:hypothetical protein